MFYSTIRFDHFFLLLVLCFLLSSLILGAADPRPHPLTQLVRHARYRVALARWRRRYQRRVAELPQRVPGASLHEAGAP